jgi:excisionase family DNA binding protein
MGRTGVDDRGDLMPVTEGAKATFRALRGTHHQRPVSAAEILTADEVAEMLRLRTSTVHEYARRGLLPSIKLGRSRRFVRADVEAEILLRRQAQR